MVKDIIYRVGDVTVPIGDGERIIANVCNDYGAWATGLMFNLSARCTVPEARYLDWYNERGQIPLALDVNPFRLGGIQFAPLFYPPHTGNIYVCNMLAQTRGVQEEEMVDGMDWKYNPLHEECLRVCLAALGNRICGTYFNVHIPRIGANTGDWPVVKHLVIDELCNRDIEVIVYDLPKASMLETEIHSTLHAQPPRLIPITHVEEEGRDVTRLDGAFIPVDRDPYPEM